MTVMGAAHSANQADQDIRPGTGGYAICSHCYHLMSNGGC